MLTVHVDIFAQLNFRAASHWLYFRVDKFSCIKQVFLFLHYSNLFFHPHHIFAFTVSIIFTSNQNSFAVFPRNRMFLKSSNITK